SLNFRTVYSFGSVWEQRGERIERATSLRNSSHFQPMAEDHDRDQRREFPPDFNLEKTESCGKRRAKGHCDCQADEGHHAGLVVRKLAPGPTDEDETAVNEDRCSEDWRDQVGAEERRCSVPKPVLDIGRP